VVRRERRLVDKTAGEKFDEDESRIFDQILVEAMHAGCDVYVNPATRRAIINSEIGRPFIILPLVIIGVEIKVDYNLDDLDFVLVSREN
jgi:hypothetical protein